MERFFEGLYKHHMFKGMTPDGKEVFGALVPHGSLSLNVAPSLPPVVMWHMIELATINGEPQNTDVMVDLETVGISLGWTNEQGRPVYVPLKELADAWKELVAYRATKLTPDDLTATFDEKTFLRLAARVLDTTPERLQEFAHADQAGRLVVLPADKAWWLKAILGERERQDQKWGFPQENTYGEWGSILAEEAGELCKELNELNFGRGDPQNMETEAVQVAAVALSILEHTAVALSVTEQVAKALHRGATRPKCFYGNADLCRGMSANNDDEPIEACKRCWYCSAGYRQLEAEAAVEKGADT